MSCGLDRFFQFKNRLYRLYIDVFSSYVLVDYCRTTASSLFSVLLAFVNLS